jgi:hypothetical protein
MGEDIADCMQLMMMMIHTTVDDDGFWICLDLVGFGWILNGCEKRVKNRS